ncbi:hypothetical protein M422DRAFT_47480 [Sphaerobolus stellatus SS14]|uniref:Uncharacterized protein n=1 Tax=Sphaerobolus stellatus (strain SS14) TaxID=990650 RepID=A0A0C9ULQ9_SPHS4|nr:hypothetical protein M422DRAFT_47480 [Sphaerobolus stellatus SS14]
MDVLMTAAKDAGAHADKEATSTSTAQPKHHIHPIHQQELHKSATNTNTKVKQIPTRKVKPSYIYIDEHGSIVPQENVAIDAVPNMIIELVSEAEMDPEYEASSVESSASDTDGEMEIDARESVSNVEHKMKLESKKKSKQHKAAQTAAKLINNGLLEKKCKHKHKNKTSKNKTKGQDSCSLPDPPKKNSHTQTDVGELGVESGAQDNAEPLTKKRPPIYSFYEVTPNNNHGQPGSLGDKHYRCYHGMQKILTVTKKMKGSQTGLIGHLQTYFPAMFHLYSEFKAHLDRLPTVQELQITANIIPLDSKTTTDYIQALEVKTGPLIDTF